MGSITDSYSALSEVLLADQRTHKSPERDILSNRLLRPLLPAAIRLGRGQIVDVKDRVLGPFDIIGCGDAYPLLGEGMGAQFLADGVAFCLQVRNWKEEDLTQFADMAMKLKSLIRRTPSRRYSVRWLGFHPYPRLRCLSS